MGHDLLDDRYGRFWELPIAMAGLGAQVHGIALDYRGRAGGHGDAGVAWQGIALPSALLRFGRPYVNAIDAVAHESRPDVVWACSDIPHAAIGRWVAQRLGARLVVDLYDNFESYGQARIPGFPTALRSALRAADGVTCVSIPLADHVRRDYGVQAPVRVIENAVPATVFHPRDRQACRRELGLPAGPFMFGTAGALSPERGTDTLIEAFVRLRERQPDALLLLAGPIDSRWKIPEIPGIHYLGVLPQARVPLLIGALDVSVVSLRDTPFGRYCFPQKLYESLACGVPVVVSRIGAMAALLQGHPANLYEADNVDSLAAALIAQSETPRLPPLPVPRWQDQARKLLDFLSDIAGAGTHPTRRDKPSA